MSEQASSQEIKSMGQNSPSAQPLDTQMRSSSTSSSSGPATGAADNKAPVRVTLKTKDDNDCAFHAVLGVWDDKERQVICTEAKQRRAEVKSAIEDSKAGSRIRELAVAGIKELIMTGRAVGEKSRQLLHRYQQFLTDQNALSPQLWRAFEVELRKHSHVVDHIASLHQHPKDTTASLREQFYDALNRNEGELYAIVRSLTDLDSAFKHYNELAQTTFDWEGAVFSEVIAEYAHFVGRPGQWLLQSEVAILAEVFRVTVEYYSASSAKVEIFNPGQQNKVVVQFNGVNHFEQMSVKPPSSARLEQKAEGKAQHEQGNKPPTPTTGLFISELLDKLKERLPILINRKNRLQALKSEGHSTDASNSELEDIEKEILKISSELENISSKPLESKEPKKSQEWTAQTLVASSHPQQTLGNNSHHSSAAIAAGSKEKLPVSSANKAETKHATIPMTDEAVAALFASADLPLAGKTEQSSLIQLNTALEEKKEHVSDQVSLVKSSKQYSAAFPYEISQQRGSVPADERGQFLYVDEAKFQSRFIPGDLQSQSLSTMPYYVVVNIPFYAGSTHSIAETIGVFENTGFGPSRETSIEKASRALVFVVGINMMESLEPERNNKVREKLAESIHTRCEVHCFGFYWRPKWVDSNSKQEISFETMREHYLELKKKNPVLAKTILQTIEKVSIKMVPYREIREVLKQHFYTTQMAKIFRAMFPNVPVYLGLFDPDMISASAVFDTYADLISDYQASHSDHPPTVLTTGYRVPHLDASRGDSPLYALAVELDMAVRHATARSVKNGVYYPEPNILVLFSSDSMNESFMEGASLQKPKDYTESYEWPIFMEDLIKKRNLDPNDHFIFDASNPIITSLPDRMQFQLGTKENTLKIFHGKFNLQQKIIRWRISDIIYLIATAQSHALPKSWASRLTRSLSSDWDSQCLTLNYKNKKLTIQLKELRKTLEKVLKVFFEQLDPLSMLDHEDAKDIQPKMKRFSKILSSYFFNLPLFLPDEDDIDPNSIQQKGVQLVVSVRGVAHNKIEALIKKWDNKDIQCFLLYILGKNMGTRFIRAGFNAGKALAHLYIEKLNTQFSELTCHTLSDFYAECNIKTNSVYLEQLPFTPTQQAILAGSYDPDDSKFTTEQLSETGKYRLNGLHIAALVGDAKLVNYAKEKVPPTLTADGNLLALHCAILFLINNGVSETNNNDIPLVTALVSEETRFIKIDVGLTALGLALSRLENAGPIAKQCMLGWDVPDFVHNHIESMAQRASLKERQTPILAIMNKSSGNYAPRSLFECAKHGFSLLDTGIIENHLLIGFKADQEILRLEEIVTTPLAESIRQDDPGTFRKVLDAYKESKIAIPHDLVDKDGRPLAISAVINCRLPNRFLSELKVLGIPLAVIDPYDGSPILHEAIAPAASRRMGGTAPNRKRYYNGFKEFLTHKAHYKPASYKKLSLIKFLLDQAGIDVNQLDLAEESPLDIALEMDYPLVIWLLLQAGAHLDPLSSQQKQKLIQSLGFLYFVKEIDKDSFAKSMAGRKDFTQDLQKAWKKITNEIDEAEKDSLFTYQFLINTEENYEKLFTWFRDNKPLDYVGIEEYIERSFSFYLLNYSDVCSFFSIPLLQRKEEFDRLFNMQYENYCKIKKSTDTLVQKVYQGLIHSKEKIKKDRQKNTLKEARSRGKKTMTELPKIGYNEEEIYSVKEEGKETFFESKAIHGVRSQDNLPIPAAASNNPYPPATRGVVESITSSSSFFSSSQIATRNSSNLSSPSSSSVAAFSLEPNAKAQWLLGKLRALLVVNADILPKDTYRDYSQQLKKYEEQVEPLAIKDSNELEEMFKTLIKLIPVREEEISYHFN